MAATPAQIREAIRAALAGVFAPTVQVSAYRLEAPMDICMQIIGTSTVEYDQSMQRGLDYWTFQLQAIAGSPVSQQAQTLLDTWKAPASGGVKATLEADTTLGGVVQALRVIRVSGDQVYAHPQRQEGSLGCVFDVFVANTGK